MGNSGIETILLELVGWKPEWEMVEGNPDNGRSWDGNHTVGTSGMETRMGNSGMETRQ